MRRFTQDSEGERVSLFDETLKDTMKTAATEETRIEELSLNESGAHGSLAEPLVGRRDIFKKESMDDASLSYFYQTGELKMMMPQPRSHNAVFKPYSFITKTQATLILTTFELRMN